MSEVLDDLINRITQKQTEQPQQNERKNVGGNAPWYQPLTKYATNNIIDPITTGLSALDAPRALVSSALREGIDLIGPGDASWSELNQQYKDRAGFGTLFPDPTPSKWLNRGIGFVGEVLLDPLTYVAGSGFAGKAAKASGKRIAAAELTDTLGTSMVPTTALRWSAQQGNKKSQQYLRAIDGATNTKGVFKYDERVRISDEAAAHLEKTGDAQWFTKQLIDLAEPRNGPGGIISDELTEYLLGAQTSGLRLRPFWINSGGYQLIDQPTMAKITSPLRQLKAATIESKPWRFGAERIGNRVIAHEYTKFLSTPSSNTFMRGALLRSIQHLDESTKLLERESADILERLSRLEHEFEGDATRGEAAKTLIQMPDSLGTRRQQSEAITAKRILGGDVEAERLTGMMRDYFAEVYDWATTAGVQMGHRENYFPWWFNREGIEELKEMQNVAGRDFFSVDEEGVPSRVLYAQFLGEEVKTVKRALMVNKLELTADGEQVKKLIDRDFDYHNYSEELTSIGHRIYGENWIDILERDTFKAMKSYTETMIAHVKLAYYKQAMIKSGRAVQISEVEAVANYMEELVPQYEAAQKAVDDLTKKQARTNLASAINSLKQHKRVNESVDKYNELTRTLHEQKQADIDKANLKAQQQHEKLQLEYEQATLTQEAEAVAKLTETVGDLQTKWQETASTFKQIVDLTGEQGRRYLNKIETDERYTPRMRKGLQRVYLAEFAAALWPNKFKPIFADKNSTLQSLLFEDGHQIVTLDPAWSPNTPSRAVQQNLANEPVNTPTPVTNVAATQPPVLSPDPQQAIKQLQPTANERRNWVKTPTNTKKLKARTQLRQLQTLRIRGQGLAPLSERQLGQTNQIGDVTNLMQPEVGIRGNTKYTTDMETVTDVETQKAMNEDADIAASKLDDPYTQTPEETAAEQQQKQHQRSIEQLAQQNTQNTAIDPLWNAANATITGSINQTLIPQAEQLYNALRRSGDYVTIKMQAPPKTVALGDPKLPRWGGAQKHVYDLGNQAFVVIPTTEARQTLRDLRIGQIVANELDPDDVRWLKTNGVTPEEYQRHVNAVANQIEKAIWRQAPEAFGQYLPYSLWKKIEARHKQLLQPPKPKTGVNPRQDEIEAATNQINQLTTTLKNVEKETQAINEAWNDRLGLAKIMKQTRFNLDPIRSIRGKRLRQNLSIEAAVEATQPNLKELQRTAKNLFSKNALEAEKATKQQQVDALKHAYRIPDKSMRDKEVAALKTQIGKQQKRIDRILKARNEIKRHWNDPEWMQTKFGRRGNTKTVATSTKKLRLEAVREKLWPQGGKPPAKPKIGSPELTKLRAEAARAATRSRNKPKDLDLREKAEDVALDVQRLVNFQKTRNAETRAIHKAWDDPTELNKIYAQQQRRLATSNERTNQRGLLKPGEALANAALRVEAMSPLHTTESILGEELRALQQTATMHLQKLPQPTKLRHQIDVAKQRLHHAKTVSDEAYTPPAPASISEPYRTKARQQQTRVKQLEKQLDTAPVDPEKVAALPNPTNELSILDARLNKLGELERKTSAILQKLDKAAARNKTGRIKGGPKYQLWIQQQIAEISELEETFSEVSVRHEIAQINAMSRHEIDKAINKAHKQAVADIKSGNVKKDREIEHFTGLRRAVRGLEKPTKIRTKDQFAALRKVQQEIHENVQNISEDIDHWQSMDFPDKARHQPRSRPQITAEIEKLQREHTVATIQADKIASAERKIGIQTNPASVSYPTRNRTFVHETLMAGIRPADEINKTRRQLYLFDPADQTDVDVLAGRSEQIIQPSLEQARQKEEFLRKLKRKFEKGKLVGRLTAEEETYMKQVRERLDTIRPRIKQQIDEIEKEAKIGQHYVRRIEENAKMVRKELKKYGKETEIFLVNGFGRDPAAARVVDAIVEEHGEGAADALKFFLKEDNRLVDALRPYSDTTIRYSQLVSDLEIAYKEGNYVQQQHSRLLDKLNEKEGIDPRDPAGLERRAKNLNFASRGWSAGKGNWNPINLSKDMKKNNFMDWYDKKAEMPQDELLGDILDESEETRSLTAQWWVKENGRPEDGPFPEPSISKDELVSRQRAVIQRIKDLETELANEAAMKRKKSALYEKEIERISNLQPMPPETMRREFVREPEPVYTPGETKAVRPEAEEALPDDDIAESIATAKEQEATRYAKIGYTIDDLDVRIRDIEMQTGILAKQIERQPFGPNTLAPDLQALRREGRTQPTNTITRVFRKLDNEYHAVATVANETKTTLRRLLAQPETRQRNETAIAIWNQTTTQIETHQKRIHKYQQMIDEMRQGEPMQGRLRKPSQQTNQTRDIDYGGLDAEQTEYNQRQKMSNYQLKKIGTPRSDESPDPATRQTKRQADRKQPRKLSAEDRKQLREQGQQAPSERMWPEQKRELLIPGDNINTEGLHKLALQQREVHKKIDERGYILPSEVGKIEAVPDLERMANSRLNRGEMPGRKGIALAEADPDGDSIPEGWRYAPADMDDDELRNMYRLEIVSRGRHPNPLPNRIDYDTTTKTLIGTIKTSKLHRHKGVLNARTADVIAADTGDTIIPFLTSLENLSITEQEASEILTNIANWRKRWIKQGPLPKLEGSYNDIPKLQKMLNKITSNYIYKGITGLDTPYIVGGKLPNVPATAKALDNLEKQITNKFPRFDDHVSNALQTDKTSVMVDRWRQNKAQLENLKTERDLLRRSIGEDTNPESNWIKQPWGEQLETMDIPTAPIENTGTLISRDLDDEQTLEAINQWKQTNQHHINTGETYVNVASTTDGYALDLVKPTQPENAQPTAKLLTPQQIQNRIERLDAMQYAKAHAAATKTDVPYDVRKQLEAAVTNLNTTNALRDASQYIAALDELHAFVDTKILEYDTAGSHLTRKAADGLRILKKGLTQPEQTSIGVTAEMLNTAAEHMQLAEWFTGLATKKTVDPAAWLAVDQAVTTDHTPLLNRLTKTLRAHSSATAPSHRSQKRITKIFDTPTGPQKTKLARNAFNYLNKQANEIIEAMREIHEIIPHNTTPPAAADAEDILQTAANLAYASQTLTADTHETFQTILKLTDPLPFDTQAITQLTQAKQQLHKLERNWQTELAKTVLAASSDANTWEQRIAQIRVNRQNATTPNNPMRETWQKLADLNHPARYRYTNDIDINIAAETTAPQHIQRLQQQLETAAPNQKRWIEEAINTYQQIVQLGDTKTSILATMAPHETRQAAANLNQISAELSTTAETIEWLKTPGVAPPPETAAKLLNETLSKNAATPPTQPKPLQPLDPPEYTNKPQQPNDYQPDQQLADAIADNEKNWRLYDTSIKKFARILNNKDNRKLLMNQTGFKYREYQDLLADADLRDAIKAERIIQNPSPFFKHLEDVTSVLRGLMLTTPGVHVRNAIGGMFNNLIAGVKPQDYQQFVAAYRQQIAGRAPTNETEKYAREALSTGILGRGLFQQEIPITQQTKWWNPWAGAAGGNTIWTPVALSRKLGGTVEDSLRGALGWNTYKQALDNGSSHETAMRLSTAAIDRFHFNYADLSNFDRGVRNAVPFWTWISRNLGLQLEMLSRKPQWALTAERLYDNIGEGHPHNPFVPAYFANNRYTQIGQRTYFTPELPHTDAIKTSLITWPPNVITNLNPAIRAPIEIITGRDTFRGYELAGTELWKRQTENAFPLTNRLLRVNPARLTSREQTDNKETITALFSLLGIPIRYTTNAEMLYTARTLTVPTRQQTLRQQRQQNQRQQTQQNLQQKIDRTLEQTRQGQPTQYDTLIQTG